MIKVLAVGLTRTTSLDSELNRSEERSLSKNPPKRSLSAEDVSHQYQKNIASTTSKQALSMASQAGTLSKTTHAGIYHSSIAARGLRTGSLGSTSPHPKLQTKLSSNGIIPNALTRSLRIATSKAAPPYQILLSVKRTALPQLYELIAWTTYLNFYNGSDTWPTLNPNALQRYITHQLGIKEKNVPLFYSDILAISTPQPQNRQPHYSPAALDFIAALEKSCNQLPNKEKYLFDRLSSHQQYLDYRLAALQAQHHFSFSEYDKLSQSTLLLLSHYSPELEKHVQNFDHLDLKGIDLRGKSLKNANLKYTNLHHADLQQTNLCHANLQHAYLKSADLRHANLSYADLRDCDLRQADLRHTELHGAYLQYTDLRDADLRGIDFQNLGNMTIDGIELPYAKFACAKLRGAKLDGCLNLSLQYADLQGITRQELEVLLSCSNNDRNLQRANMQQAKLAYINLSDSYLVAADLHKANLEYATLHQSNLRYVNFEAANLRYARLHDVQLYGAKLSGCDLWGAQITLAPSEVDYSDTQYRNLLLNHFENNGISLLTTIETIDNRHANIKISLMSQVIDGLIKAASNNIYVDDIYHALKEILLQNTLYLKSNHITVSSWAKNFLKKEAQQGQHYMLDFGYGTAKTTLLLEYACKKIKNNQAHGGFLKQLFSLKKTWLLRNNSLINQLLYHAQALITADPIKNSALQELTHDLLQAYTQHSAIAPLIKQAISDALCEDNAAPTEDLIFISPDKKLGLVMHKSFYEKKLLEMPDEANTPWTQLVAYRKIGRNRYENILINDPEKIFAPFPILLNKCRQMNAQKNVGNLLAILNLGDYLPDFQKALKTTNYTTKFTESLDHQFNLGEIFKPLWEGSGNTACITLPHRQTIFELLRLKEETPTNQGAWLFALASLFTKYSSKAIFGTADNSPEALRFYSLALLNQAYALYPTMLSDTDIEDYRKRLTGQAFHCTDTLFNMMQEAAHKNTQLNLPFFRIVPIAWGGNGIVE